MKHNFKGLGPALVLACVSLGAPGCIFSPSFGEGSGDSPTGNMDMGSISPDSGASDMNGGPDLSPPPDDSGVPDDDGGEVDLTETECEIDEDCGDFQTCSANGVCMDCPLAGIDVNAYCRADNTQRCGTIPTGLMGTCAVETVSCEPCDQGTRCSYESADMSGPGECVPGPPSGCLSTGEVSEVCGMNSGCERLQSMCPEQGFVPNAMCESTDGSGNDVCTLASEPLVGRGHRVALGQDRVVVTQGAMAQPVVYAQRADGLWQGMPFSVSIPEINALFGDNSRVVTAIEHMGQAVAMAEDDRRMAIGVQLMIVGGVESGARNAVLVFEQNQQGSDGGYTLTNVLFGEDDSPIASVSLSGSYLAVGTPNRFGGRGQVTLYNLSAGAGASPIKQTCGLDQTRVGLGADVALTVVDSEPIVFVLGARDVFVCSEWSDMSEASLFQTLTTGSRGSIAVSGQDVLISGEFLDGEFAELVRFEISPSGTVQRVSKKRYDTSHSANPVMPVVDLQSFANDTPQVLFGGSGGVQIAPAGHTQQSSQTDAFMSYLDVAGLYDMGRIRVLAADANADGEVVMVGASGAGFSSIFFAQVPVP